jgi:hypothetical protein
VLLALLVFMTDRYRWMMDDAFIYFRYADNLLFLGRGLVYNAGEYVEGFSSPLWMLLLVAFRATGIDYYTLVRGLAIVCAAAYGVGLIWVNRRLSPAASDATTDAAPEVSSAEHARSCSPIVNFPLAASAAHYGITTHFSSGLETPLVQLIAPLYAAALLAPERLALQLAVALAPLVRSECALLTALYVLFLVAHTRRIPWVFLGCAAFSNGAWVLFRVIFYADFLPNTFYLKDAASWRLGLEYWQNVSETHHWPLWLLALAVCAWLGRSELRAHLVPRAFMVAGALLYGLYVARIGGDMLYHRYASLPVCLGLCASGGIVEAALIRLKSLPSRRLQLMAASLAVLVALAFGIAAPPQMKSHPFFLPKGSRKWLAIADPNWHRRHRQLEYTDDRAEQDAQRRKGYAEFRARGEPAQPPLIVEGFCVLAFERYDAYIVHDFGLTDLALARLPRVFGRPGHKLVQVEADQIRKLRSAARTNGIFWYEQPRPPNWVRKNHDALAFLERKLHNSHALAENLKLALTRVRLE